MQKIKRKIRIILYKLFGNLLFELKTRKRRKIHQKIKREHSKLESAFRKLEQNLQGINYPNNDFNKIMSMVLSDLELFEHIVRRFRHDRQILSYISRDDQFLHFLGPNKRSYPSHPYERDNNAAIKIDVQSLFMFGMIMISRSLLLLKMYLPDRGSKNGEGMYHKIGNFYFELSQSNRLSNLSQKFKDNFLTKIKWLYSALRFYRNEFIEHLDKGYQQGMNFGVYGNDFALSSYKWNYGDSDDEKVEKFRAKLENAGVQISGRSSGGRSLINRYYIQRVFDNIEYVPDNLLKEALDLIEEVGVHSPQPEKVISEIEGYMVGVLNFMSDELKSSELIKYKNSSAKKFASPSEGEAEGGVG
ncbi:MAG: hypothetical protein L6Q29_01210 [Candidatus Pacebacteria bacterium]|nr:hypothetical protein [Candidatus Paceibacterota bacterium]NUQ57101.1 hypothetical protein [Candidatus Paceibacter sp.]